MALTDKKVNIIISLIDDTKKSISNIEGQINGLSQKAEKGGGILSKFGGALSNVFQTALGFITANLFQNIGNSLLQFGKDVILGGANLQRLQIATEVLGKNSDVSKEKIDGMVKALEDTNTFGTNAYNAINGLLRSGLLPMVEGLDIMNKTTGKSEKGFDAFIYTIKDLASAMGITSSQGIEVVTRALITQRDEELQGLGINVNLRRAFELFAKQSGKTADELDNTQRAQAILNAVMEEGEKVAGTYNETYKTAGKNILSIQDAFESFKDLLGIALAPAIQRVTQFLLDLTKDLRTLVQNPEVGAFLKGLSDGFTATFEGIGKTMSEIWTTLQPILAELGKAIESIFKSFEDAGVNDTIKDVGKNIGDIVKQSVIDFINNVKDAVVRFSEYLKSDDGKVWLQNFKKTLEGIGVVLGIIIQFVGILINLLPTLVEQIKPAVELLYKLANLATLGTLDTNLQNAIKGYEENKKLNDNYEKYLKEIENNGGNFPSFAVGTNFVPKNMLAFVHKGEAIVPARYNNNYNNSRQNLTFNITGNNPREIAQEVQKLFERANSAQKMGLNPAF